MRLYSVAIVGVGFEPTQMGGDRMIGVGCRTGGAGRCIASLGQWVADVRQNGRSVEQVIPLCSEGR